MLTYLFNSLSKPCQPQVENIVSNGSNAAKIIHFYEIEWKIIFLSLSPHEKDFFRKKTWPICISGKDENSEMPLFQVNSSSNPQQQYPDCFRLSTCDEPWQIYAVISLLDANTLSYRTPSHYRSFASGLELPDSKPCPSSSRQEWIRFELNYHMTENIPPKGMSFSDFIATFATSAMGFYCLWFPALRQVKNPIW